MNLISVECSPLLVIITTRLLCNQQGMLVRSFCRVFKGRFECAEKPVHFRAQDTKNQTVSRKRGHLVTLIYS